MSTTAKFGPPQDRANALNLPGTPSSTEESGE